MTDIVDDLKGWLRALVEDKPHLERSGQAPGIEIDLIHRAIQEIEKLRAAVNTN